MSKNKRLLLIDYDPEARSAMARALSDAGYTVQAYGLAKKDWQPLEARLQNGDFDAVVIDPETCADNFSKDPDKLTGIKMLNSWRERGIALPPVVVFSWCNHRYNFPDQKLYERGVSCVVDKINSVCALLETLNCLWETQAEAKQPK